MPDDHHDHGETARWKYDGLRVIRDDRLVFAAEAGPGDFIHVPPYAPHQEINGNPDQVLECVLVRSDNEAVVVNITDVHPVEPPESVCWVDPIHSAPQS